jgi:hypothetical protein
MFLAGRLAEREQSMEDQIKKTPVALVLLAWLFVGLPWTWGVTQLWKNARKLFQSPPAATAPVAPGGAATPALPNAK